MDDAAQMEAELDICPECKKHIFGGERWSKLGVYFCGEECANSYAMKENAELLRRDANFDRTIKQAVQESAQHQERKVDTYAPYGGFWVAESYCCNCGHKMYDTDDHFCGKSCAEEFSGPKRGRAGSPILEDSVLGLGTPMAGPSMPQTHKPNRAERYLATVVSMVNEHTVPDPIDRRIIRDLIEKAMMENG